MTNQYQHPLAIIFARLNGIDPYDDPNEAFRAVEAASEILEESGLTWADFARSIDESPPRKPRATRAASSDSSQYSRASWLPMLEYCMGNKAVWDAFEHKFFPSIANNEFLNTRQLDKLKRSHGQIIQRVTRRRRTNTSN